MELYKKHKQIVRLSVLILLSLLTITVAIAEEYQVNNEVWSGGVINPEWINSTEINYDFEVTGTPYTARVNIDPTAGNSIQYTTPIGGEMFLQPQALNYVNDLDQIEQISQIQSSAGVVSGNAFVWSDAYGTDIDLRYVAKDLLFEEELIIANQAAIGTPPAYMDGSTRYIEFNLNIVTDAKILIDGAEWDKKTSIQTNNSVDVLDANTNELLYTLNAPFAIDANNNTVSGEYTFKKQGSSLFISKRIPYTFFETAVYPVIIDPTFEIDYSPIPGELLSNGLVLSENDSDFGAVSDVTTTLSDNNTATSVEVARNVRASLSYNAFDEVGGTNINTETATAGDGLVADVNGDPQITTTTPVRDASRLLLRVAPRTSSGTNVQYFVQNAAGDQTYASFTLSSTPGAFQNYDLILSGIPEGGINDLRIREQTNGNMQLDYVEVRGNDRNQGDAVSGHWTQTYDSQWNYWLRVYKNTSDIHEATVFAYADSNNISNQSVTATLAGSGWFNINVSSLMEWQFNNTSLNSTDLRYYTEENSGLSELLLRQEGNDSTPPSIGTCTTNNSVIYDGESAVVTCPVTDNLDVANVTGNFGGSGVLFSQRGTTGNYDYEYTCSAVGDDQIELLSLVNATDIVGLSNTTNPSVSVTCKRFCDYDGDGAWSMIKSFACEISTAVNGFGNEILASTGTQINITQNVSNFSSMNVTGNTTVYISNNTVLTIE